jgi:rhamnose transport system substrate-binding protein
MEREGSMRKFLLATAALMALAFSGSAFAQATATPGQKLSMVLLPKFLGIAVFDQAHKGALEAQKELQNPTALQFLGPTPENSVAGQIEIVTNATTQGVNAIMISNNSGDQIVPAAKAAQAKGIKVVSWDSPIPSAEGEDVFVAQVDFAETGKVMADMALSILGADGDSLGVARCRQSERLDQGHGAGAEGSEIQQAQAGRPRLRQRPVGEELQSGTRAGG